jgi:HupE / UreJ protein
VRNAFRHLFIGLALAVLSSTASAHKASDAYILLKQASSSAPIQANFAIALRDLDRAFDMLDANNDRALSFAEVKAALPEIERWAGLGMGLQCGSQAIPLAWKFEALEERSDGVFVRLASASAAPCDTDQSIQFRYTLMQDIDADHRAIVSWSWQGGGQGSAAIKPGYGLQSLGENLANPSEASQTNASNSAFATVKSFVALGIGHIGSGADHIAFIICLVLTLVLTQAREWKALLITITAFTLGHSITLISATLGWVGSPHWVEPVIALSIAVSAAFNLIKPRLPSLQSPFFSAMLAASFGLVHGLGFSGAMTEAQLPEGNLLWALLGFNIGVEIGQLLIIAAWALIYWALHRWKHYPRIIVQGGSVALILLAMVWFLERIGLL